MKQVESPKAQVLIAVFLIPKCKDGVLRAGKRIDRCCCQCWTEDKKTESESEQQHSGPSPW